MNTQLISAESYDTSRIIFSEPVQGSIPDSKPAITYSRINISTKNDDGTIGDLILSTEECYSFGVSENTNIDTGKVNGFVMPIVLHSRNGATEKEKAFVETFNNIVEKCKDYLIDNKEDLGQYDLERNDLKKLNPLYYKKEKGKVVDGAAPTLYAKLIVSKKQGDKVITVFFNKDNGQSINALDLLGKHCYVKAAIKFESIFIGNKISLQVKLYECQATPIDMGFKRLLPRPESSSVVRNETRNLLPTNFASNRDVDEDEPMDTVEDKETIDDGSDYEPPVEETIKVVPKKTIKKVVKKVIK
jgi:hypothetical protein